MRYVHYQIDPRLAEILARLDQTPMGQSLADRLARLVEVAEPTPVSDELKAALRSHLWLLDRASLGGIPLTAANYLKPVDVKTLAEILPTMEDWIFKISREVDAHPVLGFREFMQRIGLLRKYKGSLVLSKAGKGILQDPAALWNHLSDNLIPTKSPFDETAALLVLLHTGTSPDERISTQAIANTLDRLGWAHSTGKPVTASDVQWVANDVWDAIGNVGTSVRSRRRDRAPSPAAIALIRDTLLTEAPLTEG